MRLRRNRTIAEASKTIGKREWLRSLGRCARYLLIRAIVLLLTVLVGIYAAIWVVNWGGASDAQRKDEIEYQVRFGVGGTHHWQRTDLTREEKQAMFDQWLENALRRADLDKPFAVRSIRYFREACTLSLGNTLYRRTRLGSTKVKDVLLEVLPRTVLLFGVANFIIFFGGLFIALALSRRYGSPLDRLTTLLVPVLSAPPWFHGFILIVIFASLLKLLPWGGLMSPPIPETTFGYVLGVLKHLILPVSAIVLGTLPFTVYSNRALFLAHASDDYVEMAMAKGLSPRRLQFRYVLRPVLPPILTNFVFISIMAWEGVVITESIFNWPGLTRLFVHAMKHFEVGIITGAITLLAYLVALSVLFLDVLYVLADPRVTLGVRRGRS